MYSEPMRRRSAAVLRSCPLYDPVTMTIRFTCDECGSVLKIKDELAGTDGKCPKCKKPFVVPSPEASEAEPPQKPSPVEVKPATPARATAPAAPAKPTKRPADDDEFDPVSFLMEKPKKRPAAFNPSPVDDDDDRTGEGLALDDAPASETPAPAKRWGARKETSAADAASRSLGAGTGNAARDLLTKSMEESRVRASEMPEEKPRFDFDFAGFFREFGLKGGGILAVILLVAFGLYRLTTGMMGDGLQLPEMGYVSGQVTYQGKPQAGIILYFTPTDVEIKGSEERWRASTGMTDENGEYTMYYIEGVEGVKTGRCQVSLETLDAKILIPDNYTIRGGTTVEVSKGSNAPYNIEIK